MYDAPMTDNNDNEEKKITMYGIWIVDGHPEPIAYFEFAEHAEDWARENYFGNWLMHEVKLPIKHPLDDLTTEQLEKIEADAQMLLAKLKPLPEAKEEKETHCDYCHKNFPMSELKWVRGASVLSCSSCMPGAIADFEAFCEEND